MKKEFEGVFADAPLKTNEFAYRMDSFNQKKKENEWRILFVGDSVTFGHGIKVANIFPTLYQNQLQEQFPEKEILAINTGVPGYSTMQEYFTFKEALKFKPDVVVLQFTINDVSEPFTFQRRLGGTGIDYHEVFDVPYWHYLLSQNSGAYLFFLI